MGPSLTRKKFFPLITDLTDKQGNNEDGRVVSPGSISTHLTIFLHLYDRVFPSKTILKL